MQWKKQSAVALAVICIFIFLSSSFQPWTHLPVLTAPLTYPIHLIQHLAFQSTQTVSNLWHDYLDLRQVAQDNHKLKQQLLHREQLLIQQKQQLQQIDHLKALLDFKQRASHPLIAAEVMSMGGSHFGELIKVNQGARAGIKVGMPAVAINGVVGMITRVHRSHSLIQPLSSIRSRIHVLVQRTHLRGILKGSGRGNLLWEPQAREDLMIGDTTVSSGLVGSLPKGYPVATVASITYSLDRASKIVELQLLQDPSQIETLFIILTPDPALETLTKSSITTPQP